MGGAGGHRDDPTNRPWVLDSKAHWLRGKGSATKGIVFTGGSDQLQPVGFNFDEMGVELGDLIIIENRSTALAAHKKVWRIGDYDPFTCGVVDANDGTVLSAAGNETVYTHWRIERPHANPPTNSTHPGRYPNGSAMYGRLASKATGTFSNNDPGYRLRGGG